MSPISNKKVEIDKIMVSALARPQDLTPYQAQHKVERLPNLFEYLGYVFCCGNLLAGPFMEFKEYVECLEEKGVGVAGLTLLGGPGVSRSPDNMVWIYDMRQRKGGNPENLKVTHTIFPLVLFRRPKQGKDKGTWSTSHDKKVLTSSLSHTGHACTGTEAKGAL